jgi:hypothetical protein
LEHVGDLADQLRAMFGGVNTNRRARKLQSTEPRTSKLFVSEPLGAVGKTADLDKAEVFLADEGVCGVKVRGDEQTAAVSAIAFKGCGSDEYSDWYGVQGRSLEMLAKQAEALAEEPKFENAFGKPPETFADLVPLSPGASADTRPTGIEDLGHEWVDEGNMPFDGFSARSGSGGIGALSLTRDANYTTDKYAANALETPATLGNGNGQVFPHPRFKPAANETADAPAPAPLATLGTRLVGAVIKSDNNLKSIAMIYKDDCADVIEDMYKYIECKGLMKDIMANGGGRFPTDEEIVNARRRLRL